MCIAYRVVQLVHRHLDSYFIKSYVNRRIFYVSKVFLKRLPKEDGKSILDWEYYYIEQTRHMWGEEQKNIARGTRQSRSRVVP
ncbi:hypothetical protein GCM10020331_049740 [Ectobacillus funiculus]